MKSEHVMDLLEREEIEFELYEHPPLYTVEQSKAYDRWIPGGHCKNMLLANKNRSAFYLLILESHKRMNFKRIERLIGVRHLKFAKEETLMRFDTFSGSVSPFVILEDFNSEIQVYLDEDLLRFDQLNFHPNINTLTIGMKPSDFLAFMEKRGHGVHQFAYGDKEE